MSFVLDASAESCLVGSFDVSSSEHVRLHILYST